MPNVVVTDLAPLSSQLLNRFPHIDCRTASETIEETCSDTCKSSMI